LYRVKHVKDREDAGSESYSRLASSVTVTTKTPPPTSIPC